MSAGAGAATRLGEAVADGARYDGLADRVELDVSGMTCAACAARIEKKLNKMPGVENCVSVSGYSLLDGANASNSAAFWIVFTPWDERGKQGLGLEAMIGQLWMTAGSIQEAEVVAFLGEWLADLQRLAVN